MVAPFVASHAQAPTPKGFPTFDGDFPFCLRGRDSLWPCVCSFAEPPALPPKAQQSSYPTHPADCCPRSGHMQRTMNRGAFWTSMFEMAIGNLHA
eukprot:1153084-Pelagomonas_calceolata.AAC.11